MHTVQIGAILIMTLCVGSQMMTFGWMTGQARVLDLLKAGDMADGLRRRRWINVLGAALILGVMAYDLSIYLA